jgi:MFS family permease
MTSADTPAKGGLFYGWIIVFAAFVAFGLVYGTVFYSYTIFANPIAETFKVPVKQVLLGFTLFNVGCGILGIFAGPLLGRVRIRNAMIVGALILAAGFAGLSFVTNLTQLYLLYAIVIAFGSIIVSTLGASAIVANWFHASRGRALTLSTLGTSFGQLVIPKVAAGIIQNHGWQTAYQVYAVMLVVIAVPVFFFLVVDRPEQKGLRPYGDTGEGAAKAATVAPKMSLGEILGRADFWTVAIGYLFTVVVYLAVVAAIVPYAKGLFHISTAQGGTLAMTMGIAAIIGKLGFATWTDRMGLRNTFWIAIALNLIGCILLAFVPSLNITFVAAALVGASAGGVLPVWPGLVAFRFGRLALPQVMGVMSPLVLSLQGFGGLYVTSVGPKQAFITFIVMLLLSAIITRGLTKENPTAAVV